MTDLFIRSVPEKTINKIDQKIQKLNRHNKLKLTRAGYVRMILNHEADQEIENYQRTEFEMVLKHEVDLHELEIKLMTHIIHCLATGEVTEAINFVDSLNGKEN